MFKMKKLAFLAIAVSMSALVVLAACSGPSYGKEALASCLADKDVKMYGAYWCSHCENQKNAFGSAFNIIDYVECDPKGNDARPAECAEAGIKGYPTWEIGGKLYPGEQPLDRLAALAGCEMQ